MVLIILTSCCLCCQIKFAFLTINVIQSQAIMTLMHAKTARTESWNLSMAPAQYQVPVYGPPENFPPVAATPSADAQA